MYDKSELNQFINELPKAELHVHIEGTLEPEMLFELAKRNKIDIPYGSVSLLKSAYTYSQLQDFLDIYYRGASVLRTEQDFYELTYAYFKKLSAQNVKHAEIMFDPQTHLHRGIAFETVINAITKARLDAKKDFGISSFTILSFLRHLSEQDAIDTFKVALAYRNLFTAVGLDSSEIGHPPEKFKKLFDLAKNEGFITVAHAGEEGPAQNVRDSINMLHVSRIDHGYAALDDPQLMSEIVEKQIPLTFCPLSNLALKVVKKLEDHPLKKALELGANVSVNSDDPAYFHGHLNDNYVRISGALKLNKNHIKQLAINSFKGSFLNEKDKAAHIALIDQNQG